MKKILWYLLYLVAFGQVYAQVTPNLWKEYVANPNSQPNIPNCSYAGYHYGDKALPEGPATVFNVKDAPYSAKGDNSTDDTESIRKAIRAAEDAGGGIVYIPKGHYICSGVLFINADNVILRGESETETVLHFTNSLTSGYAPNYTGGSVVDQIMWSWAGGMIWITPRSKNTYLSAIPENFISTWLGKSPESYAAEKEEWNVKEVLSDITSNEDRGEFSFTVASADKLAAGQYIAIRYKNAEDWSLMKYCTGDGQFAADYTWGSGTGWLSPSNRPYLNWIVQIASVSGNKVTLMQPLRIPLRAEWEPQVVAMGDLIKESGVENMTLELEKDYESQYDNSNWRNANHNREKGWNGIYMNNAVNCFARNITVYDAEMSAGVAASKNVTFTGIKVYGKDKPRSSHHGFTCRVQSQDILFENFELAKYSQFDHGINVEDFSMGCVWHNGIIYNGCFDTHKLIPAECLRTNIKVKVGGGYGGAGEAGPQIGARFVHWNVEIMGKTTNTITPSVTMPMGALVGIYGDSPSSSQASGCIVEASNLNIDPVDLYVAQKQLRNGVVQETSLQTPWSLFEVPSRIEAEDAKVLDIAIEKGPEDDGSDTYLQTFDTSDKTAEYDIRVEKSGLYRCCFRVCSEDRNENTLSIINRGVEIGTVTFNGSGKGNWRTVETTVLLNPGIQTLQIRGQKGATCLNYIEIEETGETSSVDFPLFATLPGEYNAYVEVSLVAPDDADIFYRVEGESGSFKRYAGEPIGLSSSATVTAFARLGGVMSLQNSAFYQVAAPKSVPCRILAVDYSTQNGMSIQNASPNNQLSVGQDGDWADYYVDVAEAGYYQINTRISIKLRNGVTSTGFAVAVNDEIVKTFLNLPNMGGNWDRFKVYPVKAYLKAGINQIRLISRGKRFNFDWLEIISAEPISLPGVIEAENYDENSTGLGLHRVVNTSDGREAGYEVAMNTGAKYCYKVNVDVTGTYPITFVLSSRASDGKGKLSILENGTLIATYAAPQVSGSQYESQVEVDAHLPKGAYTLLWEQPGGGEHYIEKLIVGQPKSTDPSDPGVGNIISSVQETSDSDGTVFSTGNGLIHVNGFNQKTYAIYNLQGEMMQQGVCNDHQLVDIQDFSAGCYVFSIQGDRSVKIVKR